MYATHRLWFWRCAAPMIVTLLIALFGTVPSAYAAEAVIADIRVEQSGELTLRASGFGSREVVNSWVSGTDGSVFPTESGVSTEGGAVYLTVKVGRFWQPGWWAITLLGSDSGSKAIATFEILPTPPDGVLTSDRSVVAGGERINARGTGFTPVEIVKAWLTLPDGTAIAIAAELRADGNGDVYIGYDLPATAAPGTWYITAYGVSSQRLSVGSFTVVAR